MRRLHGLAVAIDRDVPARTPPDLGDGGERLLGGDRGQAGGAAPPRSVRVGLSLLACSAFNSTECTLAC